MAYSARCSPPRPAAPARCNYRHNLLPHAVPDRSLNDLPHLRELSHVFGHCNLHVRRHLQWDLHILPDLRRLGPAHLLGTDLCWQHVSGADL